MNGGILRRTRNMIAGAAADEGAPAVQTGDVLVIRDGTVHVVSTDGVTDGWSLVRDSGASAGLSFADVSGGGGGGGAPTTAEYVVLSLTGGLSAERELDVSGGITLTDNGANSTVVIGTDADLTAIAALSGTGGAYRIAADTWALRTMVAPAAGLTITNADGVSGPPTFALANDLAGLEGLSTTGLAVRTGTSTWATRSVAIDAGSTSYASWANANGVSANPELTIVPTTIVRDGLPPPPRISYTGKSVEWMQAITANSGTVNRLINTTAYATLHYEETQSATYDAICPSTTSGSAAGSTITLALYAPGTGNRPGALLWYSGTITASNANVNHTVLFSSGTWTTAGNAYKDGSGNLVLSLGQFVWKAAWGSAGITWRNVPETVARNIGYVTPVTASSKFLGVDFTGLTYPTWPDPAPAGSDNGATSPVALPLRIP